MATVAKAESLVTNNKAYWLGGAALTFIAIVAYIIYNRNQNQLVINNIMAAIKPGASDPITTPGAANYGDSRDLGASDVFSPGYWQKNPSKVTIWAVNGDGTPGPAEQFTKTIYSSSGSSAGPAIVGIFKSLKSKEDVSKLADVFQGQYQTDLYDFLNQPWMTGHCDPTQDTCYFGMGTNYLKQIYDWIVKQLN